MRTLKDTSIENARVLVQISMDVPINNRQIEDDTRLVASLPTITQLLEHNNAIVLFGHIGRPDGVEEALSTAIIAQWFTQKLGMPVQFIATLEEVERTLEKGGRLAILENYRFTTENDDMNAEYAHTLAAPFDYFVQDDFPDAHRRSASNVLVPTLISSCAGLTLTNEIESVQKVLTQPREPVLLIVGGAKPDKIGAINNLLHTANSIIVGGVLANTFLAANGVNVQGSKTDERSLEIAGEFLRDSEEKFLLPVDVVVSETFAENSQHKEVPVSDIPSNWMILDVGSHTIERYKQAIADAGTIIWGGPIGVFEWEAFSRGTHAVAQSIAKSNAYSFIGGGDSGNAIHMYNLEKNIDHVSIGGGAALSLLGGKTLPAVEALENSSE